MTTARRPVYKAPQSGQPLISVISSGCKTPILEIKFSNLLKPFYYPNSPTVPRYSVTCIADPNDHREFLKGVQTIERNEKVETIIKNESTKQDGQYINTGKVIIKFQSKEKIPIYVIEQGQQPVQIDLEDEFAPGEKVMVVYDVLRYTKKNTAQNTEHGLSFKPSCIYFYPSEPLEGEDL